MVFADSDSVPASDRGLAYGDGLFETIRMKGRQAVLRRHHLNRLASDAGRLGITVDYESLNRSLNAAAEHFSPANGHESWVLKMILTRGSGGRGYRLPENSVPLLVVSAASMPPMPDVGGVIARRADFPLLVNPKLAGLKTLNRLDQVMASREFTGVEWEMIMCDPAGNLVEGTRTNLLARLGDEWVTPPVSSVAVAGVMRQFAIEHLQAAGSLVVERPLSAQLELQPGLSGLYLLNSLFGVVSVKSLDGVDLPVDGTLATICDPLETLE